VTFLDRNAALEEEVKKVLRELFPRRVIQPNAYALANLGYFYTLDFLFAPESSYVSLAVSEKAAK